MKKSSLKIILAGLLLAGITTALPIKGICGMEGMSMAKEPEAAKAPSAAVKDVKEGDAGKTIQEMNKICPVMGGEAQKNVNYEYKGKMYYFCCPNCVETFKKDPEKYIKKLEEMEKEEKEGKGKMEKPAGTEEHEEHHKEGK